MATFEVVLYDEGTATWPARPVGIDVVRFIGPTEPPDWTDKDEWRKTEAPAAARGLLGKSVKTASQLGITAGTTVDISSLSVTVDVEAGRRVRIDTLIRAVAKGNSGGTIMFARTLCSILRGATGIGTALDVRGRANSSEGVNHAGAGFTFDEPGAGTFTYKVTAMAVAGTTDIEGSATGPCWIAVYDDGPV